LKIFAYLQGRRTPGEKRDSPDKKREWSTFEKDFLPKETRTLGGASARTGKGCGIGGGGNLLSQGAKNVEKEKARLSNSRQEERKKDSSDGDLRDLRTAKADGTVGVVRHLRDSCINWTNEKSPGRRREKET